MILQTKPSLSLKISAEEIHLPQVCIPQTAEQFCPECLDVARFRIKKKQKTLNLERTVADLTGRSEELEREASELRRENSWLKEIVLLKSGRLGAFGGSQHSSSQQLNTSSSQGRKDGPSSDMTEDDHATHK